MHLIMWPGLLGSFQQSQLISFTKSNRKHVETEKDSLFLHMLNCINDIPSQSVYLTIRNRNNK